MQNKQYKVGQLVEGIKTIGGNYQEYLQGEIMRVIQTINGICLEIHTHDGEDRLLNVEEVVYVSDKTEGKGEAGKLYDVSFDNPDVVGLKAAEEDYDYDKDDRSDEVKNLSTAEEITGQIEPEDKERVLELLNHAIEILRS